MHTLPHSWENPFFLAEYLFVFSVLLLFLIQWIFPLSIFQRQKKNTLEYFTPKQLVNLHLRTETVVFNHVANLIVEDVMKCEKYIQSSLW